MPIAGPWCLALALGLLASNAIAQPPQPAPKPAAAPPIHGEAATQDEAKGAAAAKDAAEPAATAAAPTGGPASTITAYQEAVNAFKYQDFDNAIKRLRALLYPRTKLEQKREWQAREYLGAALWWHDDRQAALDEFTALLVRNPQARLDPTFYPPQMIQNYEGLRSNLVRLGVIRADQKATVRKLRPVTLPPAPLAWIPFGVGQIANDEPLKGTAFLVAEMALGIASATLYNMNALDTTVSQSRRAWQVSTGVGFWFVAGWGVLDAVLQRRVLSAALKRESPPPGDGGP